MKTLIFVLIQAGANVIQAITGFGGGPLSMPPSIALVGIENARPSITMLFMIACTVVTIQNLKQINKKKLALMLCFMLVGMAIGLKLFAALPKTALMIIFGLIVVGIGISKLFNTKPRELSAPWNIGALVLAGAMQAMFTSGGPFLVLYAAGALKDKAEFRATVSTIWAVLNFFIVISMYRNGDYTPYNIKLTALSILPIFAAIAVGNRINKRIDGQTFLKLVYVLLIVSGAILVMNAVI